MSAASARAAKRVPYFSTSEYVEIDIAPEDLEAAGWRYVGKDDSAEGPPTATVLEVVRQWHNETHDGPWQWCVEQPCDTLRGRPPQWQ